MVWFPIVQVSDYSAYYGEARGFAGLGPLDLAAQYAIGPKLLYVIPFRLFGDSLQVVGVTNTLLYAAALVLLYAGTLRVFDRPTALLTIAVCAVSLSELYFINLASTETLGTFFIAAIFVVTSGGLRSWRSTIALGVVGGLAVYNRSNIFPMGALAFAQVLLMRRDWREALRKGALVQLLTIAVTLPLCFFNLRHYGRFTPLIANPQTLWYGNNPKLSGDFHHYTDVAEDFPKGDPERARLRREFAWFYLNPDPDVESSKLGPYEKGDLKVRYALGWIRQNPGRYLQLIGARFQLFFFSCTYGEAPFRTAYSRTDPAQPRWTPAHERLIEQARLPVRRLYQFLIAGAAIGLVVTVIRHGPKGFFTSTKSLPLLIIAYYSTPFLLTIGANRYHIPILCLCWVYLAHGLVILGRALRPRSGVAPRPLDAPALERACPEHHQALPPDMSGARLRVAVVAKLEDHKLVQKLQPFVAMPEVAELVLIRRRPLALAGVRNVCPPPAIAGITPLAEPWRLMSTLRAVRGWPRDRSFLVSFFLMPHALHADVAGRLFGIRTVPVALSQEDVELALRHPLIRLAVRRAHAVGVRGSHSRRLLIDSGIDPARVFEPPNVHDLPRYQPGPAGSADLDVVYAGALVPVKQLELLLRALALVKAKRPQLRAAIVGGGYLRPALEGLSRELGLGSSLEFSGARPHEEVAAWLRRARVFVMTSKVEGLPMAMVEALSCGVPVVLPDVGDVTTVAKDGENAWIVRQPSPEAYADAITTLLEDEPRRARLAQGALAARARFADEYSLEAAQRAWQRALLGRAD